ncbi:MAG: hypothetical protein CMP11_06410 [Zetaproteobacteria bacterium]|nr:hypothetical protein [Pseudobdellovibrionaceae bacterium]
MPTATIIKGKPLNEYPYKDFFLRYFKKIKYDIIILGSGVTGLSTGYHLSRLGNYSIAVVNNPDFVPVSQQSAHLISGGYFDNFTRFHHTYKNKLACQIWQFSDDAFRFCSRFVQGSDILRTLGERLRFVKSEHEFHEVKKAVSLLNQNNFFSTLDTQNDRNEISLGRSVLSLQSHGQQGGVIKPRKLLEKLKESFRHKSYSASSLKVFDRGENIELSFLDGTCLSCTILVLANHLGAAKILPELDEALVPVTDQWLNLVYTTSCSSHLPPVGTVFTSHHGYVWGAFTEKNAIQVGGARFLRPFAGIGAKQSSLSSKVTKYLVQEVKSLFPAISKVEVKSETHGLTIRPMDDLPVVGPMFGEPRILVATGFLGQGLTLGLYSGYCLSQLIHFGHCDSLPRKFWPERLRSL